MINRAIVGVKLPESGREVGPGVVFGVGIGVGAGVDVLIGVADALGVVAGFGVVAGLGVGDGVLPDGVDSNAGPSSAARTVNDLVIVLSIPPSSLQLSVTV